MPKETRSVYVEPHVWAAVDQLSEVEQLSKNDALAVLVTLGDLVLQKLKPLERSAKLHDTLKEVRDESGRPDQKLV